MAGGGGVRGGEGGGGGGGGRGGEGEGGGKKETLYDKMCMRSKTATKYTCTVSMLPLWQFRPR